MLRSAGAFTFRSALRRSTASSSTRPAQLSFSALDHAPSRSTLTRRPIHTTTSVKMPHMPQGIVKGGKEDLKLNNQSLWQTKAHVNGEWVDADRKATLKVFNKATGAEIGQVPDMGAKETTAAINAAEEAFKSWSKTTAKHRHDLLMKLYYAHQENADDLAKIIVAENGKAFAEAKGEIGYSNGFLEWFAEEATRTYGHTVPSPLPGVRNVVQLQPVGVAGLITPWNFPAAMITRKAAPALAAGCTVVIKVPSETPFSALAFAHLAEKVGFPKGTINVITCAKGDNEIAVGKELCENPAVRKISFTGSTRVGKILMSQSASTLKKLSMELGGNAPFIVFEDADLDKAVEGAIACKFRGSGQTCICANRIYVHTSIKDEFLKKLAAKVDDFRVGYGMDEGTTHGPLVSEAGLSKVEEHVNESVKKGAKVVVGGKRGEGLFYEPTVITDLPDDVPTDREETFGPLAAVYAFSSEEEVVRKANNVDVGLAGYFFSKDSARCWRVAEQLQVGMVGINTGLISQNAVPFGGVHESGFGREGGRTGIDEYMVQKLMVFGGVN